ncbi:RES family NAD+ phosphorylase [Asticcacaulis sp. BYS171W]|uniref:RES family NAD+ phosphorylase n=1 Tax=Asticcacaulis aquaticus TaxID=2984212 RepID=A0ABT5HXP9_9CAUL|nr:RES family NAD+ phosphorylase [Asticcacaulis aquaticus]
MTKHVWRIATDTPDYTADDRSGAGAKATGGRWNRKGLGVVYASETIALACLETYVHLNATGLPFNRYLVRLDVPDEVWAAARTFDAERHVGWDAVPAGRVSLDQGDAWLKSAASLLLKVPSVIVPEEYNVLINPLHPDIKRIRVTKLRKWTYDQRFRS